MEDYRYTECGLNSVMISGLTPQIDDAGDEVVIIPNVNVLHRAIAESIVQHPNSISGPELRFLRTELGMTQSQLAQLVHKDAQTIGSRSGFFKYKMVSTTPNSESREVAVIVIPSPQAPSAKVVTVMWVDEIKHSGR